MPQLRPERPVPLAPEVIDELRSFNSCQIGDAVEAFGVRPRNQGFATTGFRCLFEHFPPMVGYVATSKVRAADRPMTGVQDTERTDWWHHITRTPAPRVVVMEDVDSDPGAGAFLSEVHVSILQAMGCVGAVTNGAARDVPGIEASEFQIFAGKVFNRRNFVKELA